MYPPDADSSDGDGGAGPDGGVDTPNQGGNGARAKYVISGVEVRILAERVQYYDKSGRLITESLRDYTRAALRQEFVSLDAFLARWNDATRKDAIVDELRAHGVLLDALAEQAGRDLDPFDLICHVAFDQPPLTRRQRAENARRTDVFTRYSGKARAILDALLEKYADQGLVAIDDPRTLTIQPLSALGTAVELVHEFGGRADYQRAVGALKAALYSTARTS